MSADEVLLANLAFYAAFSERDVEAIQEMWAVEADVTCIHPGWPVLEGLEAVLESWLGILANPESPTVRCADAVAHVMGSMAWVTCREVIDEMQLAATNLFVREDDQWRLVHHQAGPMPGTPSEADLVDDWN